MTQSLFVGNIAYGAMEEEIRALFAHCGTVQQVRFIMDNHKGRFRGFGFVTMPAADAEAAIQRFNGAEFQGRTLKVCLARTTPEAARRSA